MDLSSTLRAWLSHEWLVLRKACYRYTNREKLLRLRYKEKFGKEPDLENPQTLNEKVMWLMLHADDRRWSELADKYRVREYVKQCGLGHMLNELYAVWHSAEEIDLDDPRLPESFVMKPNNGYGDIVLVRNRKRIDRRAVLRRMSDAMRHRFGRKSGEWHYRAIKPCVIAERLLPADPAFGSTLVDYKFYCFDGKPRYCQVLLRTHNPEPRQEGALRRAHVGGPRALRPSHGRCPRPPAHSASRVARRDAQGGRAPLRRIPHGARGLLRGRRPARLRGDDLHTSRRHQHELHRRVPAHPGRLPAAARVPERAETRKGRFSLNF